MMETEDMLMKKSVEKVKAALMGGELKNMGELVRMWLGSCLALAVIALLDHHAGSPAGVPLLIGSFGASAVLVFGAPSSPLARPRNVIGGHVLSAFVGVSSACLFADTPWLASAVAVGTSIALMSCTGTLHPPGGATALIAVTGGEGIRQLGFLYVLVPCLTGALILLGVAAVTAFLWSRGSCACAYLYRQRSMLWERQNRIFPHVSVKK